MRRFAAFLTALLWLAPAGLRIAASEADSEAARCALACGHAAKAGAACCPMAGDGKAALASCPYSESDPPMAGTAPAPQPAVLASVRPLPAPEGASVLSAASLESPREAFPPPPDHVPLRLS